MDNVEKLQLLCCCQYNPITEEGKELDIVLASNCCVIHNQNPHPCYAEPKCKHILKEEGNGIR
jgi:hypothetical protein